LLPLLVNDRLLAAGQAVGHALGRIGLRVHTDVGEVLRGHASLSDREARSAFLHTLRTIVDLGGQRVDASDRLYLAEAIPFLLIWGEHDPIIPVDHALAAHRLVPGSRLEVFPDAGDFPHLDDPLRFVRVLIDFIDTSEPAQGHPGRWKSSYATALSTSPLRRNRPRPSTPPPRRAHGRAKIKRLGPNRHSTERSATNCAARFIHFRAACSGWPRSGP
jgi:fermentation-respiration switch protein FrsA (DUF1100 family)